MSQILDGTKIANELLDNLKKKIVQTKKTRKPNLYVILVGNDAPSKTYVEYKQKACLLVGIDSSILRLDQTVTTTKLIIEITALNNNPSVDGFILQLPLPSHIDQERAIDAIEPKKDVDGLTTHNQGKLFQNYQPYYTSCTPLGIIILLEKYKIDFLHKNIVILGRSLIVGKPLATLCLQNNATVTICHSKTKDVKMHCMSADIIIVAIGKPNFLQADWIKSGAIIVDVGISRKGNRLIGDVDYKNVAKKSSYITPVPGGVGPMTIAMLLSNTYKAWFNLCD